jgi:hypothetical protein
MGNERRMARICWNTEGWEKPSGPCGKSTGVKTFECLYGFGYEEWLFDANKQSDGWQYGFLQPIQRGWKSHQGKTYDILLYTYNKECKKRRWIGWLNNVQVLSRDERLAAIKKHGEKGGIASDIADLKKAGVQSERVAEDKLYEGHEDGFNIRFSPNGTKPEPAGFRELNIESGSTRYMLFHYCPKYGMDDMPVFST